MKKILLVFTLLTVTFVVTGCDSQTQESAINSQEDTSSTAEIAKADKVEIVDFHGTRRCYSCQTIEKYVKETLEEYFQKELANDVITFQSINGELVENQDMVTRYQARKNSLLVNAIRNGEDNIEEDTMVWRLVGNEGEFKTYFKERIENLLE